MTYILVYNEIVKALSTRVKLEKWIKRFGWKTERLIL
jgi:hypothetical protein